MHPEVDETPLPRELPQRLALRLAHAKADAVAGAVKTPSIVIACDTVVARGRRILPKPATPEEAHTCLTQLSGARHRVYGGLVCQESGGRRLSRLVMTMVSFKRLDPLEVDRYLASNEWRGKAGGYAIQGLAAAFVRAISGSYSNVVGLPLFETATLLAGLGMVPGSDPGAAHARN